MLLLIPLALILNVAALCAFMEAVDGGQFDTLARTPATAPERASPAAGAAEPVLNSADFGRGHKAAAEELELWRSRCC